MTDLALEDITHRFGRTVAVDRVSLTVGAGEVVCLVGPSGCGKSTLLRVAAGLEPLQEGRVLIGHQVVGDRHTVTPPEQRSVGLVFQDYALFPHLTVRGNVAFGLRDLDQAERNRRVAMALEQTGMLPWAGTYPHELSGGQQQRVALARALAPRPRVVLLDEPFSGLDVVLRQRVRDDVAEILREAGIATLMVTHDPEEAMYLADRIAVMRDGVLLQTGSPDDIYLRPRNTFVAAFFGEVNRFTGTVRQGEVETPVGRCAAEEHADGTLVEVLIRPEAFALGASGVPAVVAASRFLGRSSLVDVHLDGTGVPVRIHLPGRVLPSPGERVQVVRADGNCFVFPAQSDETDQLRR